MMTEMEFLLSWGIVFVTLLVFVGLAIRIFWQYLKTQLSDDLGVAWKPAPNMRRVAIVKTTPKNIELPTDK